MTPASVLLELRAAWDDEVRAGVLALELLDYGQEGVDVLVQTLRDSTGELPKLSVAILNAFREKPTPLVLQRLTSLWEEGVLSEQDLAYAASILSEKAQKKERSRLVRTLSRVRDPVNRVEVLGRIVSLHVLEAKGPLLELARKVPPEALDYARDAEAAGREEMVLFALDALEGRHAKLESIAFDATKPIQRRTAALGILCLSFGTRSPPFLRRAIQDPDRTFRGAAISLVGEIGLTESIDVLRAGLEDRDGWVVYQAYHAIREMLLIPEFTTDVDGIRALRDALVSTVVRFETSPDKTDRQIVLPALRKLLEKTDGLLHTTS